MTTQKGALNGALLSLRVVRDERGDFTWKFTQNRCNYWLQFRT